MKQHMPITLAQWFGISGVAIAASISWTTNYSIAWAILHANLSWAYVLYYALMN